MADVNAALLAFAGVLVGGYFNNFLAEDFRRFRDSQALAGALAGELESHAEAIPYIKAGLLKLQESIKSGAGISMPEWPVPSSPVFEANVEKIGLLYPALAKGVAYTYENIRAFRSALHQVSKHHEGRDADWQVSAIGGCLFAIGNAEETGAPVVESLKSHAVASYWRRPATLKQCAVGLILVAILVGSTVHYSSASEHGTNCTTTLDHGALHTVCR
jgi:hypothetical protein